MVGNHHGEDDDDGDEDEDGKDDSGKVADDPSLTSCVHSSGGLHVCSEKEMFMLRPRIKDTFQTSRVQRQQGRVQHGPEVKVEDDN